VEYPVLELRAARGWSLAQAARIFLVTPATIAVNPNSTSSWTGSGVKTPRFLYWASTCRQAALWAETHIQ